MSYIRKVIKIIDGDTFKVNQTVGGTTYIRIAGLDAPEKREPGYDTAVRNLRSRLLGKRVRIDPVGRSYGRIVAEVRVLP